MPDGAVDFHELCLTATKQDFPCLLGSAVAISTDRTFLTWPVQKRQASGVRLADEHPDGRARLGARAGQPLCAAPRRPGPAASARARPRARGPRGCRAVRLPQLLSAAE